MVFRFLFPSNLIVNIKMDGKHHDHDMSMPTGSASPGHGNVDSGGHHGMMVSLRE